MTGKLGMKGSGGARKGAGRPRGSGKDTASSATTDPKSPATYLDAESYLAAVVEGREIPDPARIAAAKAILPYQKRRQRVPLAAARPPKAQERSDELTAGNDLNARFKRRVVELAEGREREGAAK